jgi:pimeloyl-ACP methyl ester carboxylesterase
VGELMTAAPGLDPQALNGDQAPSVVTGGDRAPLLLVHGWPQTYAWRLVMPGLAHDFEIVAPDQRGRGRSGKPSDGVPLSPGPTSIRGRK